MTDSVGASLEQRILILAPTGRDFALAQAVFARAGIACLHCSDMGQICSKLAEGAAAVLLAEEAVIQHGKDGLAEYLARQPPWSDLPILVLARQGADSDAVARAMDLLGNVTVLERPTRVVTLVSAARTALRARQRQYQIRSYLVEHEFAEAALQANDRRKDEFLAILAHELRNPLAPIRNSLHILRLTAGNDSGIARVGEMMERQVNHLVRLVDDLLEVSRITRGKIELRKEVVEVASVIRTAVEASRPMIDAAGHRFEIAIPSTSLTVEADPVRLAQVVVNLLNNAAKYTDPGGQISLTVQREGDSVRISVRDTGTGIPPEMLPRIFDLFTQGENGSSRAQGGLGIGLTLVKRLVEMHGGTVGVSSGDPGAGSEFVVTLPLSERRPPAEESRLGLAATAALAPRRVLVVDDNRDAADSLGMLLKLLGAQVHIVYNGSDALEAMTSYKPGVVLLDIGMPQMDGHEVARRVRKQPEFQNIALIALTGWGQAEDLRQTELAGFDYHLIKPADIDTLETLLISLDGALEGRRTWH